MATIEIVVDSLHTAAETGAAMALRIKGLDAVQQDDTVF
jgi:hypothetical protein